MDKQLGFASGLTDRSLYLGLCLKEETKRREPGKSSEQADSRSCLQEEGPNGCFSPKVVSPGVAPGEIPRLFL